MEDRVQLDVNLLTVLENDLHLVEAVLVTGFRAGHPDSTGGTERGFAGAGQGLARDRRFAVVDEGRGTATRGEAAATTGVVLSKRQILVGVWDDGFDGDPNVVEVYVARLRRKVDEPFDRHSIDTVRGAGYRILRP